MCHGGSPIRERSEGNEDDTNMGYELEWLPKFKICFDDFERILAEVRKPGGVPEFTTFCVILGEITISLSLNCLICKLLLDC